MTVQSNATINAIRTKDLPAHDWYTFVLSYPPHLVRQYLKDFGCGVNSLVLDPFCGTGTTPVECKKLGIQSVGVEANDMAFFASRTKTDWSIDEKGFLEDCHRIAKNTRRTIRRSGVKPHADLPLFDDGSLEQVQLKTLSEAQWRIVPKGFMSPLPLHKTLILLNSIRWGDKRSWQDHQELALAKALVNGIGNVRFGPEVGRAKAKPDAPVVKLWLENCEQIAKDLSTNPNKQRLVSAKILKADARKLLELEDDSVTAVITSPPYPNEKDYTRTTRLESVILGFISNRQELRAVKENLLRSNTRNVYVADTDDKYVQDYESITRLADQIEERRIILGKDSGFERLYHRVVLLYFGGMKRHLAELRRILAPGAKLAYVVGDQMSYLRVHIKTGEILAEIAEDLGYEIDRIDLWRERLATATSTWLREEVVVLTFPGD